MFVLITIPHRFCIAKIARTCDLRAESCSKILINILNKKNMKHGTVKMTVPRIDVDFNRMKPKIINNTKKVKKIHKLPLNYRRTKLYNPQLNINQPIKIQQLQAREQSNTPNPNDTQQQLYTPDPNDTQQQLYNPEPTHISIAQNKIYNDLQYYKNDYYHDDTIDTKNKLVSKYWEAFNNRIIKLIKNEKAKQHKILLLDIHSFPKGSFGGAQIAIIDIYKTHRVKLDKFAIYIINKMHIDIRIFDGLDNHIQNTYKKSTYPLLLEFCEDRTYLLNETIKLFFEELIHFFKT